VTNTKRKKLEAKGWKFGDVQDFLDLSDEEVAIIEMKLALGRMLKERRQRKRLTQANLARLINSSQSRVAKMETGDASVSIDLLLKSLLALGASRKELARSIEQSKRRVAA
jgi:DNA-binding XRE family transcriptional regulator